jgi:hypothetical protein
MTPRRPAAARLHAEHAARLRSQPARWANIARNARAEADRPARWRPARDALWQLLDAHLPAARVAVVGAGNADDLPLTRLASRATEVVLIDIDAPAARAGRRREPRRLRRRIGVIEHDITAGAADAIAAAAARGDVPNPPPVPEAPLPGAPYDLVIGDLLYSQLLYPALLDLDVLEARRRAILARYAPPLTRGVVARLHASAPYGHVLHIHDPLAWWPGHPQPITLAPILGAARSDPVAALRLAARGRGPHESDPRHALAAFRIPIRATALWRWPFAPGVDYLACATLSGAPTERGHRRADRISPPGTRPTAPSTVRGRANHH